MHFSSGVDNLSLIWTLSRTQGFTDDRPADNERVCCRAEFGRPQIRLISSARCHELLRLKDLRQGDRGLIRLAK